MCTRFVRVEGGDVRRTAHTTHSSHRVPLSIEKGPTSKVVERKRNNLRGFKDLYLKAKAKIWP
jgi:hypothetical protein